MEHQIKLPTIENGSVGRPPLEIPFDQIVALKNTDLSWSHICRFYGISRPTLNKFRQENNLDTVLDEWTVPSDDELHNKIIDIKERFPEAGYRYVWASLKSENLRVTWKRLIAAMRIIDADGIATRRRKRLKRRKYNVKASNYLWCIDGNEKLVHWNMYIHGCVDGKSRRIIYIELALSKEANQVLKFFKQGTRESGLPVRVRADAGTENVRVGDFIEDERGDLQRPFIVGPSTRNTRIERLWRETNLLIASKYRDLFVQFEEANLLDPMAYLDLLCLVYIFFPRISDDLKYFKNMFNRHPCRMEYSRTPNQLWLESLIALSYERDVNADRLIAEEFTVGPRNPPANVEDRNFRIDNSAFNLEPTLIDSFNDVATVLVPNPLINDNEEGRTLYLRLKNHFDQLVQ